MRLYEMNGDHWKRQAPFVDTLCLPIYSLKIVNKEVQWKQSRQIDKLATLIEKELTGRLMLLPAIPYINGEKDIYQAYINQVITELPPSGFLYFVILTDQEIVLDRQITNMILFNYAEKNLSEEDIEEEAKNCVQQIIDQWVKSI